VAKKDDRNNKSDNKRYKGGDVRYLGKEKMRLTKMD